MHLAMSLNQTHNLSSDIYRHKLNSFVYNQLPHDDGHNGHKYKGA